MKKKLISLVFFILFCVGIVGIQDFCQRRTHGFTLSKASSSSSLKEKICLSSQELENIRSILNQPFYFRKKGLQCYAFASQDGKYILKVLRWREIEPSFWIRCLPSSWTQKVRQRKAEKKEHDFTSYQIAFDSLKEETGLVQLHLQKTEGLDIDLHLYDAIKVRHVLAADNIEFILQKKADLFLPYFEENKDNEQEMHSFFSQLIEIVKARIDQNIRDSDISLEYNMGILNGKPVLFDIGNLTKPTEPQNKSEAFSDEMRLCLSWLERNSPRNFLLLQKLVFENNE